MYTHLGRHCVSRFACPSSDTVLNGWPAGLVLKVTGSVLSGVLSMVPTTGDGQTEAPGPIRLDELSLYAAPQLRSPGVEPDTGELERSVATLRRSVEPYTAWCRAAYGNIQPTVDAVARFGDDTYAYLKNPPKDFYPRAGIIGFTGVLGLFLARGSRMKKLIYPAGLVAVSASLYYPEKAVAIAKSTGDCVYDRAVRSYAAVEKVLKP